MREKINKSVPIKRVDEVWPTSLRTVSDSKLYNLSQLFMAPALNNLMREESS